MEFLETIFGTPLGALLIGGLRIVDVTMATMRTIMAVRGRRLHAMGLGFFQMLFWIFAVGGALQHLDSLIHILGYAGGFALGNYVGVWLEQQLAIGTSVVRAVFPNDPESGRAGGPRVAKTLRDRQFAVTQVPAESWRGQVHVVDVVVPRRKVPQVIRVLEDGDPDAFIAVEDVQATRGGFPVGREPEGRAAEWTPSWRRAA